MSENGGRLDVTEKWGAKQAVQVQQVEPRPAEGVPERAADEKGGSYAWVLPPLTGEDCGVC